MDGDTDAVEERGRTVERPVDGTTPGESADPGDEDRLDDIDERLTELEAAVQALRGYAGSVRSVNEDVRERADRAVATVETLAERVEHLETADPAGRDDDRRSVPNETSRRGEAEAHGGDEHRRGGPSGHDDTCPTCERPRGEDGRFTPDVGKRSTTAGGAAGARGRASGSATGEKVPSREPRDGATDVPGGTGETTTPHEEPEWLAGATDRLDDVDEAGSATPPVPTETDGESDEDDGTLSSLRSLL